MVNIYSSEIKFPWEKEYKTQGICNKCSSNNPLEAIFCNMCGNKL